MTEIIIALLLNLIITTPTETTGDQDQETNDIETLETTGGTGAWVTTDK